MSRLLRLTWRRAFSGMLSGAELQEVSRRWHAPARLARQARERGCFFAVAMSRPGRLLGLVTATKAGPREVYLNRLYVLPGRQGGGLGERLLARAWRAFPRAGAMRLEVLRDNVRAIAFYRRHGFRVTGSKTVKLASGRLKLALMKGLRPAASYSSRTSMPGAGWGTSCSSRRNS